MSIKTISFSDGRILIADASQGDLWKNALFVTIVQNPETGERMATFKPAAPGRDCQDLDIDEVRILRGHHGYIGPSPAAEGLAKAYKCFVDAGCVQKCVYRYTCECGPRKAIIDDLLAGSESRACNVVEDGNLIEGVFTPKMTEKGVNNGSADAE